MSASNGLSVSALSALTWSAEDRRAWDEAYRHARSIDRRRRARERAASDRARALDGLQARANTVMLADAAQEETEGWYSVRADRLAERGR